MKFIIDKNAQKILDFWFHPQSKLQWWSIDCNFDRYIFENFKIMYDDAQNGAFDEWIHYPEENLALIILLSQFPRRMFRNTYLAYESDDQARELSIHMIKYKSDLLISDYNKRCFIYSPFYHSERLEDQEIAVAKLLPLDRDFHKIALLNKQIIEQFGRFPHRNLVLGRENSSEEIRFLQSTSESWKNIDNI